MSRIIDIGKKDFFFYEQIKALRANFESKVNMLEYKIIAVTSAISGEGKTLCSANLAANLAATGRRKVLLIDADLRKSDLTQNMEMSQCPGLTEFLINKVNIKDIIHNSNVPGLYVIPSGIKISDPTLLLAGEIFRSFLDGIRSKSIKSNIYNHTNNQFDVIIDTPPVLSVADTINLRDRVDGFILVFRARYTPLFMFRKAVEELGKEKIIGVIINGVESQKGYYYNKYYGEYNNYSNNAVRKIPK